MSAWNAMTYEGKDTILRVVRDEAEHMFAAAEEPGAWEAPTACSDWQVRDIIGHLVDTTEGYFKSFETARAGDSADATKLARAMMEQAVHEGAFLMTNRRMNNHPGRFVQDKQIVVLENYG